MASTTQKARIQPMDVNMQKTALHVQAIRKNASGDKLAADVDAAKKNFADDTVKMVEASAARVSQPATIAINLLASFKTEVQQYKATKDTLAELMEKKLPTKLVALDTAEAGLKKAISQLTKALADASSNHGGKEVEALMQSHVQDLEKEVNEIVVAKRKIMAGLVNAMS